MGDVRYNPFYERIKEAESPLSEIRRLADDEVVAALAAASVEKDPYISNVLATEAQNRMHRASAAIHHLAEGVYALDEAGRVTSINPSAEKLLGWPKGDILGRDAHETFHQKEPGGAPISRETRPPLDDVLRQGNVTHREDLHFTRRDGSVFPVAFTASPILREGSVVGTAVVFQDITDRVEAERRRGTRVAVSKLLAEAETLEELAPRLLGTLGESLGWEAGDAWLVDEDLRRMTHLTSWYAHEEEFEAFDASLRGLTFPRGIGLPGRVWETGRVVFVPDIDRDENFVRKNETVEAGFKSALGIPVLIGRKVIGAIEFFNRDGQPADEDLREMMRTIGHQVGTFIDRKRLEAGRNRLAEIVNASEDAIVGVTPEGIVESWNPGAEEVFGFPAEEVLGQSMLIYVPPERRGEERDLLRSVTRGERIRNFETERIRKDGRRIHVSLSAFPVRAPDGSVVSAAAVIHDITEQKRTEQALKESEERFRLLAENARDIVYRYRLTPPPGFEYISPAVEPITGYGPREFYEDPDLTVRITHPDDRWKLLQPPEAQTGEPLILRRIRKDGETIWTETRNVPVRDDEGRLVALQGITRDITAIKKAEERFRMLLESAPDAMIIVDENGRIRLVNRRTEKLFGYDREDLVGQTIEILVPQRYREMHEEDREEYMEHPRARPMGAGMELTGLRRDGSEFPVEISLAPWETEEGRWVTAAVRDVQERQEAEAEGRHVRGIET